MNKQVSHLKKYSLKYLIFKMSIKILIHQIYRIIQIYSI